MKTEVNNTENEALSIAGVTSSVSHDDWLSKFNKTKEGKMFNLNYEFKSLINPLTRGSVNHLSYLSNALWIAVKGTKMQDDAEEMIKNIYPDFFNDVTK
jgi:hypothetical protein